LPNEYPLDLDELTLDRAANLHRFFGRDKVPGASSLEIVTLLAHNADVAIAAELALDLLLAGKVDDRFDARAPWTNPAVMIVRADLKRIDGVDLLDRSRWAVVPDFRFAFLRRRI
jgi:hypothetical protein